jgi:hypothetical protein
METASFQAPYSLPLSFYYLILVVSVLVVSDGLGILVVVSTGIDAAVSVPIC